MISRCIPFTISLYVALLSPHWERQPEISREHADGEWREVLHACGHARYRVRPRTQRCVRRIDRHIAAYHINIRTQEITVFSIW